MENVEYLGDGLYVSFDGYQFKLMANSHIDPTDAVYLEPSVYFAFVKFAQKKLQKGNSEE